MSKKPSGLWEWLFMDRKTGKITLAQPPNAPILLFTGSVVGAAVAPEAGSRSIAGRVAVIALTWWALGELLSGANPVRRAIGGSTLGGIVLLATYH